MVGFELDVKVGNPGTECWMLPSTGSGSDPVVELAETKILKGFPVNNPG
jgi:hypothetical protein